MISVSGLPWDGGPLQLPRGEDVIVAGAEVASVRHVDGTPLVRTAQGHRLDGKWQRAVNQTSGTLDLLVELRTGRVVPVRIEFQSPLLSASQVASLRQELGELAISFDETALRANLEVGEARVSTAGGPSGPTAGAVATTSTGSGGVEHLYGVLEEHLPELLASPLRARAYQVTAVPLRDAPPSTQNLIARKLLGDAHRVLDHASVETIPRRDYAWLLRVLQLLEAHASGARRLDTSIADRPMLRSGDGWATRLEQLRRWTAHPLLADVTEAAPEFPSWALSRSVPGASILSAWQGAGLSAHGGTDGLRFRTGQRMFRLPVHEDCHLYELWVFLGILEVLRGKFGFRLAAGAAGELDSYASYDRAGRWRFAPVRLEWRGEDPFGRQILLDAEVAHEPEIEARQGPPRTPDLVLTIRGGRVGAERRTVHVLDAKFSVQSPAEQAKKVARKRYLEGLRLQPDAAYVVLPSADAEMAALMARLPVRQWTSMGLRTTARPVHGFAWGSLRAAPGDSSVGLRQFVTLALQYHRTELRHVCGNCGTPAALSQLDYLPTRMEAERGLASAEDAHVDSLVEGGRRAGELVARGRLTYSCSCGHEWSRQACQEGHLLMKHGRLTPHVRVGPVGQDPDYDLRCGICGLSRADGPAGARSGRR